MGLRNKYDCVCGYSTTLDIGSGVLSKQDFLIKSIFSDQELKEFYLAKKNGEVSEFYLENVPAFCSKCGVLSTETIFRYFINENEKTIENKCFKCMGNLNFYHDNLPCPQCGEILNVKNEGHWD